MKSSTLIAVLFLPCNLYLVYGEYININTKNNMNDNYWEWDIPDLPTPSSYIMANVTSEEARCASTPSRRCQLIVEEFGWAISNYTQCSVENARPIHLCENCVNEYLNVRATHDKFVATIDSAGNNCKDYFENLDRLQIVSEAYRYVHHLWRKANCKSCFRKDINGTMTSIPTEATIKFSKFYNQTHACFRNKSSESDNATCIDCLEDYNLLTDAYIEIEDVCRDEVCMDIVDSMNITRFIWSRKGCVRRQAVGIEIVIALTSLGLLPIVFYTLAYILANKQEAPILQQKRLAEIFSVNSTSGHFIPDSSAYGSVSGLANRTRRIFGDRQSRT